VPTQPAGTLVGLLTDYGTRDGFVAICHGIVMRLAPSARLVDLSHDVPPMDVRHGAAVLARTLPYFPPAIHLVVVDPGVGTERRGVAVRAGESILVGPDNGLLVDGAEALGGVDEAYVLTNSALWLPTVGRTFHGRDIFAPVVGHLAAGTKLAEVGDPLAAADLVRLPALRSRIADGVVTSDVAYVNRYGNIQLAAGPDALEALGPGRIDVRCGDVAAWATAGSTFGDVPDRELVLYVDSDGRVALAVNGGDAAARLGVRTGSEIVLRRSRAD
jgi:S-adenosylmethionine hydrolase